MPVPIPSLNCCAGYAYNHSLLIHRHVSRNDTGRGHAPAAEIVLHQVPDITDGKQGMSRALRSSGGAPLAEREVLVAFDTGHLPQFLCVFPPSL